MKSYNHTLMSSYVSKLQVLSPKSFQNPEPVQTLTSQIEQNVENGYKLEQNIYLNSTQSLSVKLAPENAMDGRRMKLESKEESTDEPEKNCRGREGNEEGRPEHAMAAASFAGRRRKGDAVAEAQGRGRGRRKRERDRQR